ncbi:unnamed protein product [Protopolystoma xenopodis]|uniref:Uncharacterized protein n=1 Tax=Protopolystoma xenopodis TaxID=117903 RepID=A0A3S5APF0_9PLAT|nr:unnamed protein product [Protopolystoma xenopodis]
MNGGEWYQANLASSKMWAGSDEGKQASARGGEPALRLGKRKKQVVSSPQATSTQTEWPGDDILVPVFQTSQAKNCISY